MHVEGMQVRLRNHNKYNMLHNRIKVRETLRNQEQLILTGLPIVYSFGSEQPILGIVQSGVGLSFVLPEFLLNFTASPAADLRGRLPCTYVGSAARLYEPGKVSRG